MVGKMNSAGLFLANFPILKVPKIGGDLTKASIIEVHWLISGNAASVTSNLVGGQHVHLTLIMTAENYIS